MGKAPHWVTCPRCGRRYNRSNYMYRYVEAVKGDIVGDFYAAQRAVADGRAVVRVDTHEIACARVAGERPTVRA